jgi:hypothetical protein
MSNDIRWDYYEPNLQVVEVEKGTTKLERLKEIHHKLDQLITILIPPKNQPS